MALPCAVLLVTMGLASSSLASTILYDSFRADSATANAADGIYLGDLGSTGNGVSDSALGSALNSFQAGGSIIGFPPSEAWQTISSFHRARTGSLVNLSRLGNEHHGSVMTLNFWGGSRNDLRAVWRPLEFPPSSTTLYMSSVMAVRWAGTEASSGHGIGWLYNGFGNATIATDGYANTTSFTAQPIPNTTGDLFKGLQWGFRVNGSNNGFDIVLRGLNATQDAIIEHVMLSSNHVRNFGSDPTATYFVGIKVEVNPTGVDAITYWINPELGASEPEGGTTLALFNAFNSPSELTHFGALTRGIRVHTSASTAQSGRYDDVSLGTTWASIVGIAEDFEPPPVATRVHDSFQGAGEADAANGIYVASLTGDGALGGAFNTSQSGGTMHGFTSLAPWQAIGTYQRVQSAPLANPSRIQPPGAGAVRTFNFVGSSRNNMRSAWRQLGPLVESDTYYMSSVMAVRWVGDEATSGHGIGWLYNGFGDASIATDGYANTTEFDTQPVPTPTAELFQGLQWGFRVNSTNDGFDLVLRGRNAAKDAIIEHVILPSSQVQNFRLDATNTYFVGVKVKINPSGVDEVTYWVNPQFSLTDPAGGVTVSIFNAFDSAESITHFGALTRGINSSASGYHENGSGRYASISLGTTYASIVGDPPVLYYPFGTADGRATGAEFARNVPAEWSLQSDSLRLTAGSASYTTSVATRNVGHYTPGEDFGLRGDVTLASLSGTPADNAIGHVLLAPAEDLNAADNATYYHTQWLPNASGGSLLRIRRGADGDILAEAPFNGLRPSQANPSAGIGTRYTLRSLGRHQADGGLEIVFRVSDENGYTGSVSTVVYGAVEGTRFGFGARHRSGEQAAWSFHDFGMTDPWAVDYRPVNAPIAYPFGQEAGRRNLDDLLLAHPRPDAWRLNWQGVEFARDIGPWETAVTAFSVLNYQSRQNFTIETDMTLTRLDNLGLNRFGLAVLGSTHSPFGAPFNPEDNNSYYGLMWFPADDAGNSELRIRRGFNGATLATIPWTGMHPKATNPSEGIWSTFKLKATGTYDSQGVLTLSFTMTDANGHSQTISSEITNPISGTTFGIGGRTHGDQNPAVEFQNLAIELGDVPAPGGPSFTAWASEHFSAGQLSDPSVSGPKATPAGDGISNLVKYVLNISPWARLTTRDVTASAMIDGNLVMTYWERPGATDVSSTVQVSPDMVSWHSGPQHVEEVSRTPEGELELVTVRVLGAAGSPRQFVRLKLDSVP